MILEIKNHGNFSSVSSKSYTDESGNLKISSNFPMLSKRYVFSSKLNEGTFSQILLSKDVYSNKNIAIKCITKDFDILGIREASYLQYLNKKNVKGSQLFVNIFDAFYFGGHVCLALELFRTTLIEFIHLPNKVKPTLFDKMDPLNMDINIRRPIARNSYSNTNSQNTKQIADSSNFQITKLSDISKN